MKLSPHRWNRCARACLAGASLGLAAGTAGAAPDITLRYVPLPAPSAGFTNLTLSADGRYAAYRSATGTGTQIDVFVHDLVTDTRVQADLTVGGAVPTGAQCDMPVMSADARYVVFACMALPMGSPTAPGGQSYYVYDRINNKTEVLPMTNSNQVSRTYPAAISADGHYLAYRVNNPTSPVTASLYLRNMVSRTTQVTTAKSALPIGTSDLMHVSADGRYIAYTGKVSTSLPAYATYVYDMATGVSEQADVTLAGAPVRNPTGSFSASMSADGGVVAFLSSDVALTAPPAPAGVGVYVRTRLAGQTEFISGVTRGRALSAVVSPNGRYVGFIVDPASGAERAVYVYDRLTKNSRIIPGVFINSTAASSPVFSADGRYLAFDALNGKTGVRSIGVADLGVAAGLTIAGAAPSLTEGGAAGTYTVALAQVPNASVTVTVAPDKQLSVARTQLVFTPENWNVPQVVSVQALQDGVAEGQHSGVVTHTVTSADIDYTVVKPATVTVAISDAVVPTLVLPGATWTQAELPLAGTAAPGATVLLTAANRSTGWLSSVSTVADAQGRWSYTLAGYTDGVIDLDAQADGIKSAVQTVAVTLGGGAL